MTLFRLIVKDGGNSASVIRNAPAKDVLMTKLRDQKVISYNSNIRECLIETKKGKKALWYFYEAITPLKEFKCQVSIT